MAGQHGGRRGAAAGLRAATDRGSSRRPGVRRRDGAQPIHAFGGRAVGDLCGHAARAKPPPPARPAEADRSARRRVVAAENSLRRRSAFGKSRLAEAAGHSRTRGEGETLAALRAGASVLDYPLLSITCASGAWAWSYSFLPICQTPKRRSSARTARTSLCRIPLFALRGWTDSDEGAGTQGMALSTPIGIRSDNLLFAVCVAMPNSSQETCPGPENPEPGVFTASCRVAPSKFASPKNRRRRWANASVPRMKSGAPSNE